MTVEKNSDTNFKDLQTLMGQSYYDGAQQTPSGNNAPGAFPFTRGLYSGGYQDKLWTMRMFAGYGLPEETNKRPDAGSGLTFLKNLNIKSKNPKESATICSKRRLRAL